MKGLRPSTEIAIEKRLGGKVAKLPPQEDSMAQFCRDTDRAAANVYRKHGKVDSATLVSLMRQELIDMGHTCFI